VARLVRRLRLVPVAAAAVFALAGLPACSSQAAKPHRQVPFGWMGVLAGPPIGDPARRDLTDSEVRTMAASGVESLRVALYWREGQPDGPGQTDFAPYDRIVGTAARNRVELLPTVLGVPAWARVRKSNPASSPADPADFARFMAALVDRYGPRGSFWRQHRDIPKRPIRVWQLWNEPDHVVYWAEQPYYRRYVALIAATRVAIRRRDPGAKVVLAGLVGKSWVQLAAIYRAGGRRHFDYLAVHPFTRLLPDVVRIVRYNRTVATRFGDARKPMLVTELTWPSSKGRIRRPSAFDRTERNQATLLDAAFRALAVRRVKLRIRSVYWATWLTRDRSRTDAFDYTGLSALSANGRIRRKPAFYTYRATARRLEGR
jgi:polysaccharide biosynthesis protein PslG